MLKIPYVLGAVVILLIIVLYFKFSKPRAQTNNTLTDVDTKINTALSKYLTKTQLDNTYATRSDLAHQTSRVNDAFDRIIVLEKPG